MNIVNEARKYVTEYFEQHPNEDLLFHNISHTHGVVEAARIIGEGNNLDKRQMRCLLLSAWFHDIGYLVDYQNHEDESQKIARAFLQSKNVDEMDVTMVEACIDATRMPQDPKSIVEECICDADFFHLSQLDFPEKSNFLRKEVNHFNNLKQRKTEFLEETVVYLSRPYYTPYTNRIASHGKEENLKYAQMQLEKKYIKDLKKPVHIPEGMDQESLIRELQKENLRLKEKAKTKPVPVRGIETMFRLTARNQINLSAIADNKSNILVTVTSLIISIVVTMLVRKFDEMPHLILPTIVFLTTCLVTMVIAILSTRPYISSGRFSREDIRNKKVNLLFFGNFYRMNLPDYEWGIREMMKDYDHLYGNMIMDQFFLGKVLGKKYKRLRTAYTVFMFGFVISILIFAAAMLLYK